MIKDIEERLGWHKHAKALCNNPIPPNFEYRDDYEKDVEYLLSLVKKQRESLDKAHVLLDYESMLNKE